MSDVKDLPSAVGLTCDPVAGRHADAMVLRRSCASYPDIGNRWQDRARKDSALLPDPSAVPAGTRTSVADLPSGETANARVALLVTAWRSSGTWNFPPFAVQMKECQLFRS